MQILGTKGLDDRPPFCAAELTELFVGSDALAKGGQPDEVPAMLPTGSLLRIIATLKRYRDLGQMVVDADEDGLPAVKEQIKALLNIAPPLAAPHPPRSRLVLPS